MSDPVGAYEESTFSGQPFHLYEFLRTTGGSNFYWRYTTTDCDILYGGDLYHAVPISDSGIKLNTESTSTDLDVTLPVATDFIRKYRYLGTVPSDTVWLRVRRAHLGDVVLDAPSAIHSLTTIALVVWVGTVNGVTQTDDLTAKVNCSMLAASFKRGGLRYGYQRNCPHILYNMKTCKADRENFRVSAPISDLAIASNNTGWRLTAIAFAYKVDGWFAGGFVEYVTTIGMVERKMIISHTGADIIIHGFPAGLRIGRYVNAFAGCDRTVNTCVDKFDNLANYGGFPHTPGRNPFDGLPVF